MDEAPKKSNKGAEAFNVGAVAVDSLSPNSPSAQTSTSKLGFVAIKNTDQDLLEPGENLVKTVHRHPIGIIGIYAEMVLGIGALTAAVVLAISGTFGQMPTSAKGLVAGSAILVAGFLVMILLIAAYVYRQSRLLIADKSVVCVNQKALFSRKMSRLSMSNVEDVTAEQKGILPSMLNYGTLTIQTAGEEDNFIFPLCPDPNKIADEILEARQAYAQHHAVSE